MKVKAGAAAAAAVAACLLTACGGAASSIPNTPANVSVCKVLDKVLAGKATAEQLVASVLETHATISHKLRQDLGQYATEVAGLGSGAATKAEATAKQDCGSVLGS